MLKSSEILLDLIIELKTSLKESGKVKTAEYYDNIYRKLLKKDDPKKCKRVFKEISKSAAITQYADFSFKEEQILFKIFDYIRKFQNE